MIAAWTALTVMCTAYGVTNFLQAIAATRAGKDEKLDLRLLWRLAQHNVYLAGVACQGIGTITAFIARRDLPLFLVQAAVGAGIVVTALLGVVVLRWRLPKAEVGLILAVLAGVTTLVFAAKPGPANDPSTAMIVWLAVWYLASLRWLTSQPGCMELLGRWRSAGWPEELMVWRPSPRALWSMPTR